MDFKEDIKQKSMPYLSDDFSISIDLDGEFLLLGCSDRLQGLARIQVMIWKKYFVRFQTSKHTTPSNSLLIRCLLSDLFSTKYLLHLKHRDLKMSFLEPRLFSFRLWFSLLEESLRHKDDVSPER